MLVGSCFLLIWFLSAFLIDHLTQTHVTKPCNIYSIYRVDPRYCVPLTVLVTLNSTDEVVAVAMLFSPAASGSSHPVR